MADPCSSKKKRKFLKETKTALTDLSSDELSYIFILVAQFGAADLARAMPVCRLFSEVCKRGDVLMAVNFDGVEVSECSYKNYQQISGLISLAAEAGHSAAQCMFAKIIMLSCSKLSRPAWTWSKTFTFESALRNSDDMPGINLDLDRQGDQTFMSQLNSKSSCNSKGLYQYRFIKMFLRQCRPNEFKSMNHHLSCYKVYCERDSDESRWSLRKMWAVCKQLRGYKYCWEWRPDFGGTRAHISPILNEAYAQEYKSKQELLAEFEELRFQALHDFDDIFLVNHESCQTAIE